MRRSDFGTLRSEPNSQLSSQDGCPPSSPEVIRNQVSGQLDPSWCGGCCLSRTPWCGSLVIKKTQAVRGAQLRSTEKVFQGQRCHWRSSRHDQSQENEMVHDGKMMLLRQPSPPLTANSQCGKDWQTSFAYFSWGTSSWTNFVSRGLSRSFDFSGL